MSAPRLGVGMIGHAFMGLAHSHAWQTAPRFFDLPLRPDLTVVAGRDAQRTAAAADRLGWRSSTTDWRDLLDRDDVDLIDICTPGDTHAEIAIAALQAGKHVLCEKPLANSVAEAEAMVAAAEAAPGQVAMVGYSYRRVPAIALARRLVAEGRIGTVRHARGLYLQDWLSDPATPLSWRLDKAVAGSGSLGDIGAHVIDLVQHITGEHLTGVSAQLATFVEERPVASSFGGLSGVGDAGGATGPVTVDDAAVFTSRLSGGGLALFEATRFALGRRNAIRVEINGTDGSLAFDFEDMNVLHVYDAHDPAGLQGFRRVYVTEPEHPYTGSWWPTGHGLGYEHAFTHQVVDLVEGIAAGTHPAPTFADGLQVQQVLDAVERSAADDSRWTPVAT